MSVGTNQYTLQGTNTTVLTTELSPSGTGLAAGAYFTSSVGGSSGVFNNSTQTIGGVSATTNLGGYLRCLLTMTLANPSGAFAANSILGLWFLHSIDGTNFELANSSNTRPFDAVIPIPPTATQQPVTMDVKLPPGVFKVGGQYVVGSGTQALANSGNTVVIQPYTAGQ